MFKFREEKLWQKSIGNFYLRTLYVLQGGCQQSGAVQTYAGADSGDSNPKNKYQCSETCYGYNSGCEEHPAGCITPAIKYRKNFAPDKYSYARRKIEL